MYKTDVIRKVAAQTQFPQYVVRQVLNTTHEVIQQALVDRDTVVFPGFGTYMTGGRAGGTLPDLKTRQPVSYPARRIVLFRAGAVLKRAVRGMRRRRRRLFPGLG